MQFTTIFIFISATSAAPFYIFPSPNATNPSLNITTTNPFNNTSNTTMLANTTTTTTAQNPFTIYTITNSPTVNPTVTPTALPHTSQPHVEGEENHDPKYMIIVFAVIICIVLLMFGFLIEQTLKHRRQNRERNQV